MDGRDIVNLNVIPLETDDTTDVIVIDLIDQAGTRYRWGSVWPPKVWPHVEPIIMGRAKAEAAKMHGTAQAYFEDDPERSLPE